MLSGLTSQLGGLIGKKGQQPPEDTAAGGGDTSTSSPPASDVPSQQAPTSPDTAAQDAPANNKAGSESVLSSVRNHIPSVTLPSWLGGGAKAQAAKEETQAAAEPEPEAKVTTDAKAKGRISPDRASDASSATGSCDSENHPPSEGEGDGAGANVAGLDKVKNLGNFLFSTIKGAGQKIKETNILGEFQKEHESFLKSRGSKGEAVAPWAGHPKEEALKEEIVSLSTDRRNFVRSPPTGVTFQWDFDEMLPIAKTILKEDPNLEKMRYELVPKVITEENFWRNYFYRVSLLKESMSDDQPKKPRGTGDSDDEAIEKELNDELRSFEVVGGDAKSAIDDKEIDSLLDLK